MNINKQSLAKFGLTAISVLILTACGSGGGGGSAPSSSNTTPANQVQQPAQPRAESKTEQSAQPNTEVKPEQPAQPKVEIKPEQPTQPKAEVTPQQPTQPKEEVKPEQPAQPKEENKSEQPIEQANNTGEYITVGGYGEPIESKTFMRYSADKIIIDGTELSLIPESENQLSAWNIATDGDGKDVISCCHSFSDMRVGVVNDLKQNSKTLFYNGNPTLDMPKGTVSYSGVAIFDGYEFRDEIPQRSTSSFNVNFDDKNIDGHLVAALKNDKTKTIDISARIEGNTFKGNAIENNGILKGEVKGKFFGEQAKELGGVVRGNTPPTENGWGAAFGAEKVSK